MPDDGYLVDEDGIKMMSGGYWEGFYPILMTGYSLIFTKVVSV